MIGVGPHGHPLLFPIQDSIDDMGRDALKDGLKKVIFRHSGTNELSFQDGIVTLDHSPISNLDYWEDRKKTLQQALEKGL